MDHIRGSGRMLCRSNILQKRILCKLDLALSQLVSGGGLDINGLKQRLQGLFADGLIVVVGSGMSCAEGLSGMVALAKHLRTEIPPRVSGEDEKAWSLLAKRLDAGDGLELALHKVPVSATLESAIVEATASLMLAEEASVIEDCIATGRVLGFAKLLRHVAPSTPKLLEVITTNYDRLIEFAAESMGWGVDTGFVGRLWGIYNPTESDKSFTRSVVQYAKAPRLLYRDRIRLHKPHGSLDWFHMPDGPVCSPLPVKGQRLIITPGSGKYRLGYNQPFDSHREGANAAIDRARNVLCVGYGFNDEHLQTHLTPRLQAGVPAVLLTRSLSASADAVIQSSPNVVALIHHPDPIGTELVCRGTRELIPEVRWWNIDDFVKGVLEP